jgi:hypothetical protein
VAREKQIEFPPDQTATKWFTQGMMLLSIACAVVLVIIVLAYSHGSFIGPWG